MKKHLLLILSLFLACGMQAQQHPWQGKRVAYFGDSITDPNNKAAKTKYWGYLQDWLQQTVYVYGKSGRQWNDIPRQLGLLQQEHGDDVDAIMIFMGTNDFNHGVPLGEWYEVVDTTVFFARGNESGMVARLARKPLMNPKTLRGRINIALSQLKAAYPTKQIVLLTPIHRALFQVGDKNVQPSEYVQNRIGEWFSDYVEAVVEAGRVWSVPVIDINALSGLLPVVPAHGQYFNNAETDLLHPNDEGHRRLGRTLMEQLRALPCVF